MRARSESSDVVRESRSAFVEASVSAGNPEADDAMPAPVGKELRVATRNDPLRRAQRRTRSRWATARLRNDGDGGAREPSSEASSIRSGSSDPGVKVTVDRLTHSESVIEIDAFIGTACSR